MRKFLIGTSALLLLLAGAGYLVGNYFVSYALERGTAEDPKAPPAACAKIANPAMKVPERPGEASEDWDIRSADGLELRATHFSPADETHRWAILVHGYGRTKEFAWDYAAEYLKHGYHVLAPDLRAFGESEGQYTTMGAKEGEDIALWAEEIVRKDPRAEIALHGVSMGAATVMIASSLNPAHVKAVVEDCGYTSAYGMCAAQLEVLFGLPEFPIMPCVDIVSRLKTGRALSDASPLESLRHSSLPTLFIHGDADKLVPYGMMQQLYDASTAEKKDALTIEGAGHADAKNKDEERYFQKVFSFLGSHM